MSIPETSLSIPETSLFILETSLSISASIMVQSRSIIYNIYRCHACSWLHFQQTHSCYFLLPATQWGKGICVQCLLEQQIPCTETIQGFVIHPLDEWLSTYLFHAVWWKPMQCSVFRNSIWTSWDLILWQSSASKPESMETYHCFTLKWKDPVTSYSTQLSSVPMGTAYSS